MIALKVEVNGEPRATAGVGEIGVLTAILSWVNRRSEDQESFEEEFTLEVGGLSGGEHLRWCHDHLAVGDRIVIEVVEAISVDEPRTRKREDPEYAAKAEREYFEYLKRKYEPAT